MFSDTGQLEYSDQAGGGGGAGQQMLHWHWYNQQTELLEKNIRGLIILDNVYFLLYVHIKLCSWVKAKVFHLIHNLVEKHPDLNPFYWCLKFLSKQFMDNLWGFYLNCFMISFSSEGMQWMQELEEKVKWGAMWNFIHSGGCQQRGSNSMENVEKYFLLR